MKALVLALIGAATVAVVPTLAEASVTFTVDLTTDQEPGIIIPATSVGSPRSESYGTATFTLNDALTALSFTATIFNIDITGTQTADINDNLVAAHIHAGANPLASTFPVAWGFFGAPDNDNNPDQLVVTPFLSGTGGTFSSTWDFPEGNNNTNLGAQLPNILAGRAYINFHTIQFGGGEIRGNVPAVPEPSSWAMMLLGFSAIGTSVRRKRRLSMKTHTA
jgi:hypothetical protein